MEETLITYADIRDMVLQKCKDTEEDEYGNKTYVIKNYQTWNVDGFVNGTQSYNEEITVGKYNNSKKKTYINLIFTGTISNSVRAVDEDTIKNDINNFITNNLGMNESQVNSVVNNKNYINFIIDMAIFYTTKVCMMTSNKSGPNTTSNLAPILVYIPSNTSYSNIRPIDTDSIDRQEGELTLSSNEVLTQLQAVINTVANATTSTVSNKINFSIALP